MAETATPPGFDPNANNAYLVYIPSAVFVVICPVLMGLRIWARLRKGGKLGADDWTAIAALVSSSSREAYLALGQLRSDAVRDADRRVIDICASDEWFPRGM
jgi:hypothetical protein